MAENEGLHLQLTADASSYISTINNAKNKLAELAAETRILKQGEKDIQSALAESKRKYGENSVQVDKLTADLADNAREQERLKQEIREVNTVLDKASKEYAEYGNKAKQSFESVSQQSKKTAETLKSGFNMVKGLIVGYAGKKLYEVLIGTNADYEQSLTSFEVLLQSADKADAMMQKLEKMGASTPFELSDLTGATEQLLAFSVAEQDVETKLQQLGDLAMGNADKFERLTSSYGKMLAKGKVSLEELNMFTEAGVPILEELQNQYNVTGEEMFKMISDGKVGVEEINSAMESMTSQGGQFYGMMEKQSKTLDGMMSTMSDNVTMFGRLVGEETFGILKTELEGLLNTINQMAESGELQAIARDLGQDIASAVTFIIDLVKWLYEMKDTLIAGASAVMTYKVSFTVLSSAVKTFNAIKEVFNIITGKTVVCKNLETGATVKLTAAEYAEAQAKGVAIIEQNKFNAVCNANVYVAAASAILAMVAAFTSYNAVAGEAIEKTNQLSDSYARNKDTIKESLNVKKNEINATANLIDELIALDKEIKDETTTQERANEATSEFHALAEELSKEIPTITDYLYDETGAINLQTEALYKLKLAYLDLGMAKAEMDAYQDLYSDALRTQATAERQLESAKEKAERDKAKAEEYGTGWRKYILPSRAEEYLEDAVESGEEVLDILTTYNAATKDVMRYKDLLLKKQGEVYEKENQYEDLLGIGDDNSSGSGYSSGLSGSSKKAYERVRKHLDVYIRDKNLYDNWGEDSEVAAIRRIIGFVGNSYKRGVLTKDEYFDEMVPLVEDLYKARKAEYEDRRSNSDAYMKQRDFYDDWGEDSRIKALQRIMSYTDEAYKEGIISWNEYCEEIGGLSEDLYSEIQNMVEEEKERVKEQLEEEYETKKQLMEDELEFRKQLYDKEMEYLDELKAKREDEKEDEDYAKRMARLQAKLEYEMDDDNRLALQKEIAELQEEIDDTEFERDIERKKSVLKNAKTSAEEKTQNDVKQLTIDYEKSISDVNIAEIVYKNLDFAKFKEIGELMGENLAAGMSGAMNPFISAINKLVTLGSNVQSPVNTMVNTTDNSISINQNISGVSEVPTIKSVKKVLDDVIFLNGRLG